MKQILWIIYHIANLCQETFIGNNYMLLVLELRAVPVSLKTSYEKYRKI
jgi:hypothetical protein